MLHYWYEDMVRFMKDASEYGTYNRELVARMAPYLTKEMHICDAGCGLGYLSLELAPHVRKVTSVEINPDAVAVLEENCRKWNVGNVTPRCGPLAETPPEEKYDAMVFCFFGHICEILEEAKKQCKGTVFIITRNYKNHRFSVGSHKTGNHGYDSGTEELKRRGIPYEEELLSLEFGQPFRSMEDVRKFYESYSQDADKSAITEEFLRDKVVENDHPEFPLYMPHRRSLAILRFDVKDIREE